LEVLARDVPVFCQPEDENKLLDLKFLHVMKVADEIDWKGVRFKRTGGQHGTGELGRLMGPVSGFILSAEGEPSIYLAGDTIWCTEVEMALSQYSPEVIILNGGEAQYLTGDPITMGCKDIHAVSKAAPFSNVIVVHMEAWNHCLLSRKELKQYIYDNQLQNVSIPDDGAALHF
jgi:L-ascorbate metabolism protein UlaG (beta-lactamase superfamily)